VCYFTGTCADGLETQLATKVAAAFKSNEWHKVASVTHKCRRGIARQSIQKPEQVPKQTVKVGCLFQMRLEILVRGGSEPGIMVQPVITTPHNGHEPGSREDALLLRPDPALEARAKELLQLGLRPMQVTLKHVHR
jgi:hypothetical protein